jgi:hypothetical protein
VALANHARVASFHEAIAEASTNRPDVAQAVGDELVALRAEHTPHCRCVRCELLETFVGLIEEHSGERTRLDDVCSPTGGFAR